VSIALQGAVSQSVSQSIGRVEDLEHPEGEVVLLATAEVTDGAPETVMPSLRRPNMISLGQRREERRRR
jgi:hypothetical protein